MDKIKSCGGIPTGFISEEEFQKRKKAFPKYLFKPGEKWTHVDEFGNIWYEEIEIKND